MSVRKASLAASGSIAVLSMALAAGARAAEAPPPPNDASSAAAVSELVVTARKREERLLDVPVAISALSSANIQSRGINTAADIATFSPGVTFQTANSGSGRADRSSPMFVIRGMTPANLLHPTTSVFIDGAPVSGAEVSGLDDLQRIEVLKGPQTAYFGRETFAGAINLVTKDPSATPHGRVSLLLAAPDYKEARLSAEGPLVGDWLTARATYRYYDRRGTWKNHSVAQVGDEWLGSQSTQDATLEVLAKPVENLRVKGLVMYFHDDDGPSAQALIAPSQRNCLNGTWFCGRISDLLPTTPAANTVIDQPMRNFIDALDRQAVVDAPDHYGLVRDAWHGNLNIDYYVPSLRATFSSLTSVDHQAIAELNDITNADTSAITPNPLLPFATTPQYVQSFYNWPFYFGEVQRTFSQELRAASDQDQRFRWTVGLNYEWNRIDEATDGGGAFGFLAPDSATTSKSKSVFFGLAYDLIPKTLVLNVEGRYQSDSQVTNQGARGTYNNFIPRVILQYHVTPDIMTYATYSEGVNPGAFNAFLQTAPPDVQAQVEQAYGATIQVRPERLKNYEVGIKAAFWDHRASISADVYDDIWTDQIGDISVIYKIGAATHAAAALVNNGKVNLKGVEVDAAVTPIRHLDIDLSGAINGTDIRAGACFGCIQNVSIVGNEMPAVSKYQVALGVQYGAPLTRWPGGGSASGDWDWYVRGDYVYKSGPYAQVDNLARAPDENLLNLRAGVKSERVKAEVFVENATDWKGPTSLMTTYYVANPFESFKAPDALVAALPFGRAIGVRLSYDFGD